MSDHTGDLAVTERPDHAERIAHGVEQAKAAQVAVICAVPAGCAAVAAQVGGHDVEAGSGEWRHDLAPGIGELREAVQQQDQGAARGFMAGFEDVDAQEVDVVEDARPDAGREHSGVERAGVVHRLLPGSDDCSPDGVEFSRGERRPMLIMHYSVLHWQPR